MDSGTWGRFESSIFEEPLPFGILNNFGQLRYQDITMGEMVANYRTGLGRTDVMQVNPYISVIGLGHSNGSVTMWKCTSLNPIVKMLTHHGPVTALAFHPNRHLIATAGMGKKIKLWDPIIFRSLRDEWGSQNYGRYMRHSMAKGYQIQKVSFRPYEDVLGIGHSIGLSSILIPGSGEPNFDTLQANPYETSKQRREKEVRALLEKLPPKKIGTVRQAVTEREREEEMEEGIEAAKGIKFKNKTKGRNKASKRAKKKQEIVEQRKRQFVEQNIKENEELSRKKRQRTSKEVT